MGWGGVGGLSDTQGFSRFFFLRSQKKHTHTKKKKRHGKSVSLFSQPAPPPTPPQARFLDASNPRSQRGKLWKLPSTRTFVRGECLISYEPTTGRAPCQDLFDFNQVKNRPCSLAFEHRAPQAIGTFCGVEHYTHTHTHTLHCATPRHVDPLPASSPTQQRAKSRASLRAKTKTS